MKNIHHKVFKSNPELLPEIEHYVLKIITDSFNLNEEKINRIELSVAEAAANCILHGNKNDINKNVDVTVSIAKSKINITFKDEGNGFDIKSVPDPTIPENILKGSGRGIHIMKTLVDDIKYKFSNNGTEVTLIFSI